MNIAPATIADAQEILALQHLAYQTEAAIYNDDTLPPLQDTLQDMIARFEDRKFFKAIEADRTIGSVRAFKENETCFVERLIVHPDNRRRGIGTALLRHIETQFPSAHRFELFTGQKSESNIRLYQRIGYRPFRQQQLSDKVTLVFMQKPISATLDEPNRLTQEYSHRAERNESRPTTKWSLHPSPGSRSAPWVTNSISCPTTKWSIHRSPGKALPHLPFSCLFALFVAIPPSSTHSLRSLRSCS